MKKSVKNVTYEIPVRGSLGLLAYGHKGIIAWRGARDKNDVNQKKK